MGEGIRLCESQPQESQPGRRQLGWQEGQATGTKEPHSFREGRTPPTAGFSLTFCSPRLFLPCLP